MRIAVASVAVDGRTESVGLILENATEMLRCEPDAFNPFADGPRGLVQSLDLDALLPPRVIEAISRPLEARA